MCFYLKPNSKMQTAKKDIVVYKELIKEGRGYRSLIMDFWYKYGKVQPKVELVVKSQDRINQGYHSYIKNNGLSIVDFNVGLRVAEFIIPKGSKYYTDRDSNQRVSDTIIFKRILTKKEHKLR